MMRTLFFLSVVVLAGTGGELSVSYAMKRLGETPRLRLRALLGFLGRVFHSGWMWLGVLLMALSFYAFLVLLSWAPMSFVIPATALNYVVGAVGAKFLLGEKVSPTRWAGVLLVCLGVALVCAG